MFQDETHGAQANITLKLGADLRREMRILGLDRILASTPGTSISAWLTE